jgi:hypothetical protein
MVPGFGKLLDYGDDSFAQKETETINFPNIGNFISDELTIIVVRWSTTQEG